MLELFTGPEYVRRDPSTSFFKAMQHKVSLNGDDNDNDANDDNRKNDNNYNNNNNTYIHTNLLIK